MSRASFTDPAPEPKKEKNDGESKAKKSPKQKGD